MNAAVRARAADPRGAPPPRDDSAQLRDHLLDVAAELLLSQGYGATSIEAIASRARVSKRTLYHRFSGKAALMSAVVERLIDSLRPPADVPLIAGLGLPEILRNLAALILRAALTPKMLALHRLIVAESQRFPDLAAAVAHAGGRQEAVDLIAGLLRHHAPDPRLQHEQAAFAAQQFLQLVVSLPQLRALGLGQPMTADDIEAWIRQSVTLFLGGFRQLAEGTSTRPEGYIEA
jgi:AcrR family transcriptional regulator